MQDNSFTIRSITRENRETNSNNRYTTHCMKENREINSNSAYTTTLMREN